MELKKILVPTDFSDCARAAVDQAVLLAGRHGAELCLLNVVTLHGEDPNNPDHHFPEVEAMLRRLEQRSADAMDELEDAVRQPDLNLETRGIRAIAPAPAIAEFARAGDFDLIIIGTHGRRGLRRCLMGSVTEEVLRTAEIPVLTIRCQVSLAPWTRFMVPYDFSEDSDYALATAVELAKAADGSVDLVHVVAPPVMPAGLAGAPVMGSVAVDLKRDLGRLLRDRADKATQAADIEVRPHVIEGGVEMSLLDYAAENQPDLIVMGSHGLSGIWRFLLGSVTEKVVRSAPCAVWVRHLKPEERSKAQAPPGVKVKRPMEPVSI